MAINSLTKEQWLVKHPLSSQQLKRPMLLVAENEENIMLITIREVAKTIINHKTLRLNLVRRG